MIVAKNEKQLIAGLDIGTSKVVVVVVEFMEDGKIKVIGLGHHKCEGLKQGVVVNIDATVQSIHQAIADAERMTGHKIYSVYAGIAGNHIKSLNSHGVVAIDDKEVTTSDLERVIDAAKAVSISQDQQIIHILPQEFIIDEQKGIREPIGMSGVRLEAKAHIITAASSAVRNIVKCIQSCNLSVDDIILEQLASSRAVLSKDEQDLGICLIDIGGGTSDIAIFKNGSINYTAVIPIAGDQVTNDIAITLRTSRKHAELIKIKYGCAYTKYASDKDIIEITSIGEKNLNLITRKVLTEIIEARYAELFSLINNEIERSNLREFIPAGVVITGGSAKIHGLVDLAQKILKMPVRLGYPQNVSGLADVVYNPIYSTSVGLVQYAHEQYMRKQTDYFGQTFKLKNLLQKVGYWFKQYSYKD